MHAKTYTYSQLAAASVARMVASYYEFDTEPDCKFYVLGLHDNYLIETKTEKFILRIYRNDWRTEEEIRFELELLVFVTNQTEQVAGPVPTKQGGLSFKIDSPEGVRMATLFRYAQGQAPGNAINAAQAELLAQAVAKVHTMTDTFTSAYHRQPLDVSYLLDDSVNAINPYLDADGVAYICGVRDKLHADMPRLEKGVGVYGICIGDVNPSNFHITEANKLTLFDFDQCGYGYRAFEIGKFFSSIRNHQDVQTIREGFLKGYQQGRPLSPIELEAIPIFEIVSVIWVWAIHVANVNRIGYKLMEKTYWDRRLAELEKLVTARVN
jgi:Ser/Thr protein kinase RdoA (MazF antagonist)